MNSIGSIGTVILHRKRLHLKRTGHEMYDKIATITGVTFGLKSN